MAASEQSLTSLLSNMAQTKIEDELGATAAKIALQNFHWNFMTMVYLNSTLYFAVDTFLRIYGNAVVVGRNNLYPNIAEETRQYVLFGSDLTNIEHVLCRMRDYEFDNTGKYIIICHPQDSDECNETMAVKTFWQYKITNVIFLKKYENKVAAFTYFPLSDVSCTYTKAVQLNLRPCLETTNYPRLCDLFPTKLTNLNKCALKVSILIREPFMYLANGNLKGSEGCLLVVIAMKLNATLRTNKYKTRHTLLREDASDVWSAALADVLYGFANFSMTAAYLKPSVISHFQVSAMYKSIDVHWVSPAAKKVPSFMKLIYPFNTNARIVIVISYTIVIVCTLIFRAKFYSLLSRRLKLGRPRISLVFYSWAICMGMGISTMKLPKKTTILGIVILWVWYCMVLRIIYQISLITALKSVYYYPTFENIDDVIAAGYRFGGSITLREFYDDNPVVFNSWENVKGHDVVPTLKKISDGVEFVLALLNAKTVVWREKLPVQILPKRVVTVPAVVCFQKFSPLADAVNQIILTLYESGIGEKLGKEYLPPAVHIYHHHDKEILNLEQCMGCFIIIITGWIISLLAFCAEILYDKIL